MDGLKQRIIGALVLVSLAVIFVPMLFDEPHSERTSSSIKIPEEPPFPEVDAPAPEVNDAPAYRLEEPEEPQTSSSSMQSESPQPAPSETTVDRNESASEEPEPAAQPVVAEPEQKPQPRDEPEVTAADEDESDPAEYTGALEGAWVVQLGSFGSAENARNLRNKVRDTGYSSHLQEIQRGDTTLTRVFSGPFAEKAEAERAKKSLDREFGLNSLVTSGGK
ncbi:sporulation protein [Marinobacter lipolyticus]|uniref:SPOR domain-containing protein n=1 Tax=Marinobacter lipolyticus TaxID=209639 RepID=UPI001BCB421B|nr:SPOR domain-containing protein [Marinobacter lipolyticus]MBS8239050.1 sporulation protein [Marinobacter lipolyticus]